MRLFSLSAPLPLLAAAVLALSAHAQVTAGTQAADTGIAATRTGTTTTPSPLVATTAVDTLDAVTSAADTSTTTRTSTTLNPAVVVVTTSRSTTTPVAGVLTTARTTAQTIDDSGVSLYTSIVVKPSTTFTQATTPPPITGSVYTWTSTAAGGAEVTVTANSGALGALTAPLAGVLLALGGAMFF